MIIQITKEIFDNLSSSEKAVITFINQHEKDILHLSITSIADKTYTSPATVSRAIQKCGFQGIAQLRYEIKDDGQKETFRVNDILSKSYKECIQTIDSICITDILSTIEKIKSADKIFVFCRGFTSLVGEEFCMQLHLLGYNARLVKDVTWMVKTDRLVSDKDLLIIFSVNNTTPELTESAKMAKQKNAFVVSACCLKDAPLKQYSDIFINGYAEEITTNVGITVVSRIPLYIIERTIIEYLSS